MIPFLLVEDFEVGLELPWVQNCTLVSYQDEDVQSNED